VVTYGSDLQSAYMKMETVEHFAQIALVTHILGRQQLLDGEELDKLIAARNKYSGVNSAAPMPVHSRNGGGNGNGAPQMSKNKARSLRDRAILRQSEIVSPFEN
jgi:L-fuculose-phosphate aldolase